CCINATAMDFARVGQMVLDDGEANGQQIISKEWIDRISTPAKNSVLDWGYSAQWWHLPGNDQDFSAIGIYGQYIYVNPEDDTTIVKLSDYGTEQDELETVNMMRAIAADLNNQS
ncbi:MAG: serine hydrolase, partial [Candidatus Nanopelagicales bacterium]|nr:serine hydrolase [Candidatus Nanopelagicales bacterium]